MTQMSYRDAYHQFVKEENLDKIKDILNEHEYYDAEANAKIHVKENDGLPYILLPVESDEYTGKNGYGVADGIFLDISSRFPIWTGKFYLPVMILRQTTNKNLEQFIDLEKIEEHEIHHIKAIISYIDRNPDYIRDALKYAVGACSVEELEESVEFEVEKLFRLEKSALENDFDNGDNSFFYKSEGAVIKIAASSKGQFVRIHISHDAANLVERYLGRFPGEKKRLHAAMEKSINKWGRSVFGNNAITQLSLTLLETMALSNNSAMSTRYEI